MTAPDEPPVRYYPRRLARAGRRPVLSPSQALHLPDDPRRAAAARSTDEHHIFVGAAPAEPALPAPEPGRFRRWLSRFVRR